MDDEGNLTTYSKAIQEEEEEPLLDLNYSKYPEESQLDDETYFYLNFSKCPEECQLDDETLLDLALFTTGGGVIYDPPTK